MKMTLQEDEMKTAIQQYITNLGLNTENFDLNMDFKNSRGEFGQAVDIVFTPKEIVPMPEIDIPQHELDEAAELTEDGTVYKEEQDELDFSEED